MKVLFTGPPCSGKTTVLRAFEDQGHTVLHEEAAKLIQAGDYHPAVDFEEFQFAIKWAIERSQHNLKPRELVFLDRSYLDALAFYKEAGKEPPPADFFAGISHERYFEVFLFETLPVFVKDGIRDHDTHEGAYRIFEHLKTIYPVHVVVPVMPVVDRVNFIKKHLQDRLMDDWRQIAWGPECRKKSFVSFVSDGESCNSYSQPSMHELNDK